MVAAWLILALAAPGPTPGGTGALVIETSSSTSTIDAKRLGWNKVQKGKDPFVAPRVPAGEHKLTFCNEYKCIDYRARVRAGRTLALHVDFEPGHVEDISSAHQARLKNWQTECRQGHVEEACVEACRLGTALSPRRAAADCTTLAELKRPKDPNPGSEPAHRPAPELLPVNPARP